MSKVELKQYSLDPENRETAINADIDENNEPFNRLSVWVQHPVLTDQEVNLYKGGFQEGYLLALQTRSDVVEKVAKQRFKTKPSNQIIGCLLYTSDAADE